MIGSEKQIAWAVQIKAALASEFTALAELVPECSATVATCLDFVNNIQSAHQVIQARHNMTITGLWAKTYNEFNVNGRYYGQLTIPRCAIFGKNVFTEKFPDAAASKEALLHAGHILHIRHEDAEEALYLAARAAESMEVANV